MDNTPGRLAVIGDEGFDVGVTAWLASQLDALQTGRRPQDVDADNDVGWIRHIGRETFRRAAHREGEDHDATRLAVAGVCGGAWPQGVEAVVRAALAPELAVTTPQELAHLIVTVVPEVARHDGRPATYDRLRVGRVGLATTTGWSKARGRGHEDNEDASGFFKLSGGGLAAAVLDGVTGRGDGGGGWAARRALEFIKRDWSRGFHDPLEILRGLGEGLAENEAEAQTYADAATVGVLCSVVPGEPEQVTLAFVGDARAYALLPGTGRAVRLGGEGSAVFEDFNDGISPRPGEASVVTSYLNDNGVQGRPHVVWPELRSGSWLVLLSDGACVTTGHSGGDSEHGFVGLGFDDWLFAAALEETMAQAVSPQHLAILLAMRSESLGGRDNATVLVVEFPEASVTRARSRRQGKAEARYDGDGHLLAEFDGSAPEGTEAFGGDGETGPEDSGHVPRGEDVEQDVDGEEDDFDGEEDDFDDDGDLDDGGDLHDDGGDRDADRKVEEEDFENEDFEDDEDFGNDEEDADRDVDGEDDGTTGDDDAEDHGAGMESVDSAIDEASGREEPGAATAALSPDRDVERAEEGEGSR
ncbi:hypothetical protein [Streptomyces tropicalis]|uniref:PPM-type phosphatase domain-containing protein n=1 Tax=Streptomyces tropicalis TaxID=3034234 RepID=A0ABT6A6H9_9ACTN|nr:hypothetical protein [Streptomyces tropicalis]MDF3300052.1 hypothetical protein [Streptomyces tropicalis]